MSVQKSTALAHLALACTSAWAIYKASNFSYARVGFALYTLNGLLGALAYGTGYRFNRQLLVKAYHRATMLSIIFSLPCFTAQLSNQWDSVQLIAFIYLAVPGWLLLKSLKNPKEVRSSWLDVNNFLCLFKILTVAHNQAEAFGYLVIVSFISLNFILSSVCNCPINLQNVGLIIMTVNNYFILKLLSSRREELIGY